MLGGAYKGKFAEGDKITGNSLPTNQFEMRDLYKHPCHSFHFAAQKTKSIQIKSKEHSPHW
jgi:hypothetical protein